MEPPSSEQVKSYGFEDVNVAMVNTIETFKMLETKLLTKNDIVTLMEEVVEESKKKMRKETKELIKEKNEELRNQINSIQETLMMTLSSIQHIMGNKSPLLLDKAKNVDSLKTLEEYTLPFLIHMIVLDSTVYLVNSTNTYMDIM